MSPDGRPTIVILAGPNGAGKSTLAPKIIRDEWGITEFVNADEIARGLSAFAPERSALAAGRVMLGRLKDLVRQRTTFSFETTLATRTFAGWLPEARSAGYRVVLIYLALKSPDLAVQRVQTRVMQGGHDIPEPVIRRRFDRGRENLLSIYDACVDEWVVYDHSERKPKLIAARREDGRLEVHEADAWARFQAKR